MKTLKWIVAIVIVVLGVLWYTGNLALVGISQSAAVANSVGTGTIGIDKIKTDVALLDTHLQAAGDATRGNIEAITQRKIASALTNYKSAITVIMSLRTQLESVASASKNAKTLKAKLVEMEEQATNANAYLEATRANITDIGSHITVGSNPTLREALAQLKLSQLYLQVARNDVGLVMNSLK